MNINIIYIYSNILSIWALKMCLGEQTRVYMKLKFRIKKREEISRNKSRDLGIDCTNLSTYLKSRCYRVAWFFLQTQLFCRRYDVSVSFLCAFFSSLNSIVIYVSVFSCADVAFSTRRSRSSLKEYPSCLFLRASSRESVSTYRETPASWKEGPRG